MPRIHTLDMSRLTPLGQLIAEYMRAQWPRLQTKAELAHLVGVRPTTIDNLLYSQHAASTRTLNKIARATGIPADRLYNAASGSYAPAPQVAPSPPRARDHETRHRPPRIAEQQSPYAALHEFIRSVQAWHLDEETRQALISEFVSAVQAAPTVPIAPEPPPAWDDYDAVSTLQLPSVPAVQSESSEQESQLTCERT